MAFALAYAGLVRSLQAVRRCPYKTVKNFCSFFEFSDRCCAMSERHYAPQPKRCFCSQSTILTDIYETKPEMFYSCGLSQTRKARTARQTTVHLWLFVSNVCNRCLKWTAKAPFGLRRIMTASLLKQRSISGEEKTKKSIGFV